MSPARVQTLRLLDLEVSALTKRTPHKDFKLTHQGKVVQGSLKIHIPKQPEWRTQCEVPGKVIITMTKQSFTTNIVINYFDHHNFSCRKKILNKWILDGKNTNIVTYMHVVYMYLTVCVSVLTTGLRNYHTYIYIYLSYLERRYL